MSTEVLQEVTDKGNSYNELYDTETVVLNVSKEQIDKIKAGSLYNRFLSVEEFVVDCVINVVDGDIDRHLKGKETGKIKK